MSTKILNTEADAGQQAYLSRHDAGSGANETADGLDASVAVAMEDTPSDALPEDIGVPAFDRADLAPRISVHSW
jgi:hypothetical protein